MRNFEGIIFYEHEYIRKFLNLPQLSSPGHLKHAMALARLDTHLNERRRVIDRTPREVQFFIKFYYPGIPEKSSRTQFHFSCRTKI